MPTYDIENLKTGEIIEVFCSYNEMKNMTASGKFRNVLSAPAIVSGVGTLQGHIDGGFNDVLKSIKKANRGSNIQTK